jgi:hypothetical protein
MPKAVISALDKMPQAGTCSITQRLARDIRLLELLDQLNKMSENNATTTTGGKKEV